MEKSQIQSDSFPQPREYMRILENYQISFSWQEIWEYLGTPYRNLQRTDFLLSIAAIFKAF